MNYIELNGVKLYRVKSNDPLQLTLPSHEFSPNMALRQRAYLSSKEQADCSALYMSADGKVVIMVFP